MTVKQQLNRAKKALKGLEHTWLCSGARVTDVVLDRDLDFAQQVLKELEQEVAK
jgi:hypothetical protein